MNHKKPLSTPAHHNPSLGKWVDLFVLLLLCTFILAINRRAEGSRMADGVVILELARATEGGGNGIVTFRLENGAVAPSDITITYTINATASIPAVNGVDYQTLSGTAVIPTGGTEAQVIITPVDDILIEGDENIEFTLISALDQGGVSYLTPQRGLVTTVVDNDNRISITKVNNGKELGNGNASDGAYLIKLPGSLTFNEDIPVKYLITGGTTASGGAGTTFDYDNTNLTGTIILPANTNSIQLPLKVNDDKLVEGNENVELTIQDNMLSAVTNIRFSFDPLQKSAIVTIEDDDNSIPVGVIAVKNGTEPGVGANDGSITVGWPDGFTATGPIIIRYTIAGTATNVADYTMTSLTQVVIPAGTSNVKIPVVVVDDNIVEGTETVILNITALT
ncbi:MAG TPA: Calx-beta domain-containing protein, partial [Chitinophaga sp.]|nr:Calx-beta domain-containing protein [Chitinophaga sp.]